MSSQPADRTMWNSLLHASPAGSVMSFLRVSPCAAAGGVCLSFDIDSLDAAYGAATRCPISGGATSPIGTRVAVEAIACHAGAAF